VETGFFLALVFYAEPHLTSASLEQFNFKTLTPAWTAEVNSAYASVAGGALRFAPPEQFQSEIALMILFKNIQLIINIM
jgi:hypothetical protein